MFKKTITVLILGCLVLPSSSLALAQEPAPVVTEDSPIVDNPLPPVFSPTPGIVPPDDPAPPPDKDIDKRQNKGLQDGATGAHKPATIESTVRPVGSEDEVRDATRRPIPPKFKAEPAPLTGAFYYEYPLMVPPGRNGVQPDLKLMYSSDSKNDGGIYALGWTDSVPYIERLNRNGVQAFWSPELHNFYSSLDGELAFIQTVGSQDKYGALDDDGSFRKYDYYPSGSNGYWTMTDKLGTIYKFGQATSTRQDNASSTRSYRWQLEEVRDRNDNYIKYEYFKDAGQIYPDTITYTGQGSTDGPFEIEFVREARPDAITLYRNGFPVTTNYRITEIVTKVSDNWVKKYSLGYSLGDNTRRRVVSAITETGQDASSNTITLPPTMFATHIALQGWNASSSVAQFPDTFINNVHVDNAVRLADINGDGLADLMVARSGDKATYFNDGQGGWVRAGGQWDSPAIFISNGRDTGVRLLDVNGDGLVDIVQSGPSQVNSWLNNGNGWTEDGTWQLPDGVVGNGGEDKGVRFGDVNGDGLVDVFFAAVINGVWTHKIYTNSSGGWSLQNTWSFPQNEVFVDNMFRDTGFRLVDVNGDGLVDMLKGNEGVDLKAYINDAGSTSWIEMESWRTPVNFVSSGLPMGTQLVDVNGDNLVDILYSDNPNGVRTAYLNTGAGWSEDGDWATNFYFNDNEGRDNGVRIGDFNGDGFDDLVWARSTDNSFIKETNINKNTGNRADLVSLVETNASSTIDVSYKSTANYFDSSGQLLNSNLPFTLDTVNQIAVGNGLGTSATTTYTYEGADYYYNTPTHRKFAGFEAVSQALGGFGTTTRFYHQGNGPYITRSSLGEYDDVFPKIGKVYRTQVWDQHNATTSVEISRWNYSQVDSATRFFIFRDESLTSAYDGDTTHKDKANSSSFHDGTGNLLQKIEWGEVTGSDNGSFVDTGSDKFTTAFTYAASTTTHVIGLLAVASTTDQATSTLQITRHYYDTLGLGSVDKGNETKTEHWVVGNTYIDTEKTYNAYGLVSESKDPRDKITTYTYDSFNLYPATTTNPLAQTTQAYYDYSLGKPKEVIDANGYRFTTTYDALDRVIEEKQPDDVTTPSSLVTKTAYFYTNSGLPRLVQKTDYLNAATSTDIYTYLDGLERTIQTRIEAETANTFAVRDWIYNGVGLVASTSLPYFATGASSTAATTTSVLYINHFYDSLHRLATTTNAVGTTANTYNDWKVTVTDAKGKIKHLYKDAYDNLVKVEEIKNANTFTTLYEWNGNKNLTKITDDAGNVRNFTYDGLGRLLTSQDLHKTTDTTFGTWTHTYDDSGNPLTRLDPNGTTTTYTYDDLNRPLTEDADNASSTEVLYGYDSCTGGVGRLCSATSSAVVINNQYNPLGLVKQEAKKIGPTTYTTQYTHTRQGQPLTITHPDDAVVSYGYNSAGLLETVSLKEEGGTPTPLIKSLDYSPLQQLTTVVYGNNATTTNTYDATKLYRLSDKVTASYGNDFQFLEYTYDAVGNITKIDDNSGYGKTLHFNYDDLHRLTSASTTNSVKGDYREEYNYSSLGNISEKVGPYGYSQQGTYSYQGHQGNSYANPHAVTRIATGLATTTLTYDNNGNVLTMGSLTNTWDYANRLVASTLGATTTTYSYTPSGERLTLKAGTMATTTSVTKEYEKQGTTLTKRVYLPASGGFAGDNLLVATIETDVLGSVGGGGDSPTPDPVIHYIHTDHLTGSNIVTDDTGNAEEFTFYYAFGDIRLDQTLSGFKEKRKFTGHIYDAETELSYMQSRYQDGEIARFLSQDPAFQVVGTPALKDKTGLELEQYLADPQQLNSYSYVKNNPLKYKDPTGEFVDTILDVGFIAYDVYKIAQDYAQTGTVSQENIRSLGLDVGGAFLPGVTGLGVAGRLAGKGDDVGDTTRILRNITEKGFDPLAQQRTLLEGVENPRVQNLIKDIFRTQDKIPGGTIEAIRRELTGAGLVGGKSHLTKGEQTINRISNILNTQSLNKTELNRLQTIASQLRRLLPKK